MADPIQRVRDFLVELKRRKVYHVAVIYIVAAAAALQVVDVVVPSTRLPEWSDELFLGLVLLGFPLALVLAWALEMTPEGVRWTSGAPDAAAGPQQQTPASSGSAAGEARPAEDARAGPESVDAPRPELDTRSVAVLPFDNLSGSAEAEPLANGLHDDLITALSKVAGLTVISRTSVRGYRGTDMRLPQIARELNVGTIVEGGVQSAGGRVRLNVQLIDARRDGHLWAETYDRQLSTENIFEIQSELAKRVVESMHAELTGRDRSRLEERPTDDLDAYRLYAEGLTGLDSRTEEGLRHALDRFKRAVERDPRYAPAWARLAEALLLSGFYVYELPDDAPEPEAAARRAVEMDPGLPEAHTALGIVHALRHEGLAAVRELERAVELGPSDAEAHIWLAWVHLVLGRAENALRTARRGADLNPHAPAVRVYLAEAWLANGEAGEALKEARRAREIQPGYGLAHFTEGVALYELGRPGEAESALAEAMRLVPPRGTPSHAEVRAVLALVQVAAGDRAAAREQLARIESESEGGEDGFPIGLIHAALGEMDRAFVEFGRVQRWESPATELIRYCFPEVLGSLRRDPRYEELLRDVDRGWRSGQTSGR